MPIQLQLFPDRLAISNPGGLYGWMGIDDLGKMQPDTRNPVIATVNLTTRTESVSEITLAPQVDAGKSGRKTLISKEPRMKAVR